MQEQQYAVIHLGTYDVVVFPNEAAARRYLMSVSGPLLIAPVRSVSEVLPMHEEADRLVATLGRQHRITAIKEFRATYGCSLSMAKDAIYEAMDRARA